MNFPKIILETLPSDVQKWIGPVVTPVNTLITNIKQIFSKGMSVNENMMGAIQNVRVTANTATFAYKGSKPPKAILIGAFYDLTASSWAPTGGISTRWSFSGSQVAITFYGLDSTHIYQITLVILED